MLWVTCMFREAPCSRSSFIATVIYSHCGSFGSLFGVYQKLRNVYIRRPSVRLHCQTVFHFGAAFLTCPIRYFLAYILRDKSNGETQRCLLPAGFSAVLPPPPPPLYRSPLIHCFAQANSERSLLQIERRNETTSKKFSNIQ